MKTFFFVFAALVVLGNSLYADVDVTEKTVVDVDTGLVWQRDEGGVKTWDKAVAYCKKLQMDKKNDWYLPSKRELITLIDRKKYRHATRRPFTKIVLAKYWTATENTGNKSYAWVINFQRGTMASQHKANYIQVRCVRKLKVTY